MYRLLWKLLKKQHLVSLLKNLCRNPQVGRIGSSTCGFATGDGWYPSHRSTRGRVVPSSADFGLVLFVCAVYCSHCHLNFLIIMILMCVCMFFFYSFQPLFTVCHHHDVGHQTFPHSPFWRGKNRCGRGHHNTTAVEFGGCGERHPSLGWHMFFSSEKCWVVCQFFGYPVTKWTILQHPLIVIMLVIGYKML